MTMTFWDALNPFGPGRWRAHRSSSVIGTGMQKAGQFDHGELTELNVTGGQVLVAVAVAKSPPMTSPSEVSITAHRAIAVASDEDPNTTPSPAAVRPGPVGAPVSSTNGPPPPPTLVKVNFGQTFSVESKVLEFIVIEPVEAL